MNSHIRNVAGCVSVM